MLVNKKTIHLLMSTNLFNTPTYVLINHKGEKLARRVGTFNPGYFKNYLA